MKEKLGELIQQTLVLQSCIGRKDDMRLFQDHITSLNEGGVEYLTPKSALRMQHCALTTVRRVTTRLEKLVTDITKNLDEIEKIVLKAKTTQTEEMEI